MLKKPKTQLVTLIIVAEILMMGCLTFIPFSRGQDSEKVPAPSVSENHFHNDGEFNEVWGICITHGDVTTMLGARNMTHESDTWVDYQQNIQYFLDGTRYLAQFTISKISFKIGSQTIDANITTCEKFSLTKSSIEYNGTIPTLTCNITYERLHVCSDSNPSSTVDLTLIHRVQADWNHMDIKIEALINFTNAQFYDESKTEFNMGEPFTTEIYYTMSLLDATDQYHHVGIAPSGHTDISLEYNLTLDSGVPLSVSKLGMNNNFTLYNGSGALAQVGYSSMSVPGSSTVAFVTHGFSNMFYKQITSMESDPEIIIYHNRVSNNNNDWINWVLILGVVGIIVVGASIALKRRMARKGENLVSNS